MDNKDKQYRALGLMSGSSLDGLDLAFCQFTLSGNREIPVSNWKVLQAATIPFSETWQQRLKELPQAGGRELIKAHVEYGHYSGELVNGFLQKYSIEPGLIASHGHTVFHFPDQRFTLQIGDGAAIAAVTGYPVIDNFRAMDVAGHGQGAPIAPIADRMLFPDYDFMLNLGGIANISCNALGKYIAFDIGGANQVLNALVRPLGLEYDEDGRLARNGQLNAELLGKVEELAYFEKDYPKSLGNDWVQEKLLPLYLAAECSLEDKLFTACHQLARQTALDIKSLVHKEGLDGRSFRLMATGGGAFNSFLIERIEQECQKQVDLKIIIPDPEIISFKEAMLMALMGVLRAENIPNCMASVTGANRDSVGGAVHQGWRRML